MTYFLEFVDFVQPGNGQKTFKRNRTITQHRKFFKVYIITMLSNSNVSFNVS